MPLLHGHSYFKVDGKQYQWKNHNELMEESNGIVLARFDAPQDKDYTELGRLVITREGEQMLNLAVITFLIDQERADEGKWKVRINYSSPKLTRNRSLKTPSKMGRRRKMDHKIGFEECI